MTDATPQATTRDVIADLVNYCYVDGYTPRWRLCLGCEIEHHREHDHWEHGNGCVVAVAERWLEQWTKAQSIAPQATDQQRARELHLLLNKQGAEWSHGSSDAGASCYPCSLIAAALAAVRADSAARIETLEQENALLRKQVPRVFDDDGGPEY